MKLLLHHEFNTAVLNYRLNNMFCCFDGLKGTINRVVGSEKNVVINIFH